MSNDTNKKRPSKSVIAKLPLCEFVDEYLWTRRDKSYSRQYVGRIRAAVTNFARWLHYHPTIGEVTERMFLDWWLSLPKKQQYLGNVLRSILQAGATMGVSKYRESIENAPTELSASYKPQPIHVPLSEKPNTLWHLCTSRYFKANLRITCQNTRNQYRISIQNLRQYIDHEPTLADLTEENITGMMRQLVESGMSPETINDRRARICALWTWCAKKGLIKEFPTVALLKSPERTPRAWTKAELDRLFGYLRTMTGNVGTVNASDWWLGLHLVLWDTGARIGELLACKWEWLNWDVGLLTRISHNAVWLAVDFRDRFFCPPFSFLGCGAIDSRRRFVVRGDDFFPRLSVFFRLQRARGARAGEKRFVFESSGVVSR